MGHAPDTAVARRRLRAGLGLLAAIAVIAGAAGLAAAGQTSAAGRPVATEAAGKRPNIVFVLTDDLSLNLLRYMPHVQALERRGLTFSNYFVSDSLCCPSRSSIFTGNFPHDTGVFGNTGKQGGYHVFYNRGEERHTFALTLQHAGYRTAMMGKYLNGYLNGKGSPKNVPQTHVPPGWSEWDVAGNAYSEFNYDLNQNGVIHHYGGAAKDYLVDVMAGLGARFVGNAARAGKPFFLELATFAPHKPYTPAPRDAGRFPGLTAPRPKSFDVLPKNPPAWLARHQPLTAAEIATINSAFRRRVQAVQAVDAMIARIERALSAAGVARNTYIVFSSDNGLHTGEYRLMPGKMTAFDTDIHVPLVVAGPGVPAGRRTGAIAENIDLAKTFTGLAGTTLAGDGHSLVSLLHGRQPTGWRSAALVEHHGPDLDGGDPDFQQSPSGNPRTYEAMRTAQFLYVEYNNGEREFYDLRHDPFELDNLARRLTAASRARLHRELNAIRNCHTGTACWTAMHVSSRFPALLR